MSSASAVEPPPRKLDIAPGVLKEARERVGLGRAEAWKKVNDALREAGDPLMPDDRLAGLEAGADRPTLAEVEALAFTYLVPFTAFFGTLPEHSVHDFRLAADVEESALSYDTWRRLSTFDGYYELARDLLGALGESESGLAIPKVALPPSTSTDDTDPPGERMRDALRITDALQQSWADEEAARLAVQERIEATGVFVFSLSLPLGECRGASRWDAGGPPAILLNTADSPAAQLFTLAHEYAHLMFAPRTRPTAICDPARRGADEERIANRVAAAALVPRNLLDTVLPSERPEGAYRDWPSPMKRDIRQAFKVSHDVIGIRLFHLGIASGVRVTKGFWRQPDSGFARGSAGTRAERYRRYFGPKGADLARRALETERVSPVDIAKLLDAKVADVETAFGPGPPP